MSTRRGMPASAGVPATADRRFRRPDVRPGRRGRFRWLTWRTARAAAIVGALAAVGFQLTSVVVGARILAVNRIVVFGTERLSSGEVEALISGIRGSSLLLVDLDAYRVRLLDSPWVADARLRRVLPSTIELRVTERQPMALARLGQQLYLVDDTGVIVDESGPQYADLDLPVVDGLVTPPAGAGPAINAVRAQLTARFLAALSAAPELRRQVSQIDVSDPHNVIVLMGADPALLHLGDRQFVERLRRYRDLAPTLVDRLQEIDYVDLRFDENVYVRPRSKRREPETKSPAPGTHQ